MNRDVIHSFECYDACLYKSSVLNNRIQFRPLLTLLKVSHIDNSVIYSILSSTHRYLCSPFSSVLVFYSLIQACRMLTSATPAECRATGPESVHSIPISHRQEQDLEPELPPHSATPTSTPDTLLGKCRSPNDPSQSTQVSRPQASPLSAPKVHQARASEPQEPSVTVKEANLFDKFSDVFVIINLVR